MSGRIAAIVLAAGGSRRMGHPKVLIDVDGEPLVRRVARRVLEAGCDPVFVVAGDQSAAITSALASLPVTIVINSAWSRGIGSSIAAGARAADEAGADAVLVALADQPDVAPGHFAALLAAWRSGHDPAATSYGGSAGVPAIFGRERFAALLRLDGDRGAKELLRDAHRIAGDAPADLDSPDDLAAWNQRRRGQSDTSRRS